MFLTMSRYAFKILCFPYASGGVSILESVCVLLHRFSLREWGCFEIKYQKHFFDQVFPTRVGGFSD